MRALVESHLKELRKVLAEKYAERNVLLPTISRLEGAVAALDGLLTEEPEVVDEVR